MITPPVKCGLLPGVMRDQLLNSNDYLVREEIIKRGEISMGTEIYLCNSLRGLFKVKLMTPRAQN